MGAERPLPHRDYGLMIARRVKFVEKAPDSLLDEVLSILDACLYDPP